MQNGKGDTYRPVDLSKWGKHYDEIFTRKRKTKIKEGKIGKRKEVRRK